MIASPSMAVHGLFMDGDVSAVKSLARDIIFLIDYAQTLSNTDLSKVAVAGYSYGGLAGLFAAAQDDRIKAQVALDGTNRFASSLVKAAGYVHPQQMVIPLLYFGGQQHFDPAWDLKGESPWHESNDDNLLHAWKHGDVITAWMSHMTHGNFASIYHLRTITSSNTQNHEEEIMNELAEVARLTREFLDSYLKHDAKTMALLRKQPEENGLPASVMNVTFRAAQGEPPTLEGFRAEVGRQGFEHAADIYAAMHQEYPDFKLEESKLLNAWVYFLINTNHSAEAIHLLDAYKQACPDSKEVFYLFGQAYEKADQKQLAIDNYRKALQIEPDFTPAKEKMKALESNIDLSK